MLPLEEFLPLSLDTTGDLDLRELDMVVASLPRSGTSFFTNVLRGLGVDALHERPFTPSGYDRGTPRAFPRVCVSGFVAPYMEQFMSGGSPELFHLLRHPVSTINSIYDYFPFYFKGLERIDALEYLEDVWYRHHSALSSVTPRQIYLEDHPSALVQILIELGIDYESSDLLRLMADVDRNHKVRDLSRLPLVYWEDLRSDVRDYAQSVGYEELGFFGSNPLGTSDL